MFAALPHKHSPETEGNLWLAKALWDLGAVQFGDFTVGRTTQHSPVYVNLRLLISNPRALQRCARVMHENIQTLQAMLHPKVQAFQRVCGIPFGGLHLATATAIAVVLAIGHNFVWHEHWTWADRDRSAPVLTRLLRFGAATGAVSLVGTVVLTTAYDSLLKAPVVVSNLLAVWTVGFLNYLMLDRVIYQELK